MGRFHILEYHFPRGYYTNSFAIPQEIGSLLFLFRTTLLGTMSKDSRKKRKEGFLRLLRRMLRWLPEELSTANGFRTDLWIMKYVNDLMGEDLS